MCLTCEISKKAFYRDLPSPLSMPNDTIHTVGKFDCPDTRCFCLSDLYGLELRFHGCMISFSSVMMITYWSTGTSAWIIWRKELQKHCFKWYVEINFGLWPRQNIWFKRGCMEHCSSLWHEKSIQRLILLFDYLVILSRTETNHVTSGHLSTRGGPGQVEYLEQFVMAV